MLSRIVSRVNDKRLMDAVRKGKTDKVRKMLEKGINATFFDEDGNAPLFVAILKDNIEIVKLLLDQGRVNPNATCKSPQLNDEKPLYTAIMKGKIEIVKLLLLHGADPNANTTKYGGVPIFMAIYSRNPEIAKILLDHGADAKVEGLVFLAAEKRLPQVVEMLLIRGANPNPQTVNDFSPMLHAIHQGNTALVKMLLDYGARPTHITSAALGGHTDIVKLLLDKGANPNGETYEAPLNEAMYFNHVETYKLLLERGANPNKTNYKGETALHAVARRGHVALVKDLLDRGLDINKVSREGITPLHYATYTNQANVVQFLLENGAHPSPAMLPTTPLHYAAEMGFLKIVELLVAHGASLSLKDEKGMLPIDLAKKYIYSYHTRSDHVARSVYDRIIQLLSPKPDPIPVMGQEVIRNAYKDLGVKPTATDAEIRKAYLKLKRALEKGVPVEKSPSKSSSPRGSSSSSSSPSSPSSVPSLGFITASYSILRDHRNAYDEAFVKPRSELIAKIKELCFNDKKDPVNMKKFKKMSLEELRRIYVISSTEDKRIGEARSRGHCFEKDTLKAMVRNGVRNHPMTRQPLRAALLADLAASSRGGGRRPGKAKGI